MPAVSQQRDLQVNSDNPHLTSRSSSTHMHQDEKISYQLRFRLLFCRLWQVKKWGASIVVKNWPSQDDTTCPSNQKTPSLHIILEPISPHWSYFLSREYFRSSSSNASSHLGAPFATETSIPRNTTITTDHPRSPRQSCNLIFPYVHNM